MPHFLNLVTIKQNKLMPHFLSLAIIEIQQMELWKQWSFHSQQVQQFPFIHSFSISHDNS